MKWFLFVSVGVFGGILGGMGMGGGTVLIPALTIICGVPQHTAQAINLISFVPMAASALFIHAKNGLVKTEGLWITVVSGLIFCVGGCFLARVIEGVVLKRIFGGFLVILSIFQVCSVSLQKSGKT